ncbi:UPF0481 protein At3g47200-like [Cynara cardunculus var. scolymus]|uniref:Uncharacterized protein n=1 Tax=Cynara cardunculus var. scolymus TaxID=59895 RepID=A0A103XH57_CYNCS|nr:UPF0481 protein At3g47200-like [Cynara cardunculus var. scolymus]KVH90651.1 Protein of unknown function DUF247, plant [Cynara cardunculus var. scolymus]
MNRNHVITIDQEAKLMNTQMIQSPKLLHKFAGNESCCIFRVPQSLVELNKEAYQPRIVSIGPYHHGSKNLQMIEEHKWRFLHGLISRTRKPLSSFLYSIVSMEKAIRESYSESIEHIGSNDLAKMMVLDGVFLIELFRKVGRLIPTDQDDPIFKMVWMSPLLLRDLLRIENQIPFFVIQKLFDESRFGTNDVRKLPSLILDFFNHTVDRPEKVLDRYVKLEGKHLLDFFRKSFIKDPVPIEGTDKPNNPSLKRKDPVPIEGTDKPNNPSLKRIQPATTLVVAGVKFEENHEADSFLDIEFKKGVLSIPRITMDDFYTSFFLNGMAFEQCYSKCSKDITTYVVFLGWLINNSADVGLLSESKVIENYFGTDKELVKFFNHVGKDVPFNIKDNYLKGLFIEVNEYCKNGWHVTWAGFKHRYFESPWASISAGAAFALLVLALLQTLYTMIQYYHASKSK